MIIRTDGRSKFYVLLRDGEHISDGVLQNGDLMLTSLDCLADEDEVAFVGKLDANNFPPLPDNGWLQEGDIYAYEGECVMVRQSHNRTHYAPSETPALFVTWRENADAALEWIANEDVVVGTRRMYDGKEYECVQSHTTQEDWTPAATPALWSKVVEEGGDEWQVGVAYEVGDEVTYDGAWYRCLQAHTSQADWTPPAVPALWEAMT